jgi:excisionase family DNA binding protein
MAAESVETRRFVLSRDETAAVLGISLWTLNALLASRRLGSLKAGRRVLIPVAEVARFLKEGITEMETANE